MKINMNNYTKKEVVDILNFMLGYDVYVSKIKDDYVYIKMFSEFGDDPVLVTKGELKLWDYGHFDTVSKILYLYDSCAVVMNLLNHADMLPDKFVERLDEYFRNRCL